MEQFPTSYSDVVDLMSAIQPAEYARTRNFENGAVTRQSPYISRGMISTRRIFEHVMSLDLPWSSIEKLVQELAWRDYWQQVWIHKGNAIDRDLKRPQENVSNQQISRAIVNAQTSVEAIDRCIEELYNTGYMHNHMRMYVAALACNVAQSHWKVPAQWMYAHLFDGDWASNALSWQWVAGSNAGKKYYANQENINKYFNSNQVNSYLNVDYGSFYGMDIPEILLETELPKIVAVLPQVDEIQLKEDKRILLYNYYNLDPEWHSGKDYLRVLLLEPSFFDRYPVSEKVLGFFLELARNIPGLQVYVGEFSQFQSLAGAADIIYKEHPTVSHYEGIQEERDWMFPVTGYFPSFFAFWKKCKKTLSLKKKQTI